MVGAESWGRLLELRELATTVLFDDYFL